MEISGKPNLADFFPFLGFLDLQGARKEARLLMHKLFRVFQGFIDTKRSSNASRNNNDMLDSLLDIAHEKESELDDNNIKHLLLDLFLAGVDTSSSAVEWAMADETVRAFGHHEVSIAWLPSTSSRWRLWRKVLATKLFSRERHKATKSVRSKKAKELITFIIERGERGFSVDIARACFITSLNVISNVVFSIDLGGYDPRASTELQDSLSRMMEIMGKPNLANYFPSLEFLDIQGIRKEMKVCSERLFQIFQGLIDARIAERSSQTGPRDALRGDLLDSLIDLIQEEGSEVDMNDINHFLCDLFIAGTETNSTTVEWALAELLRNPEAMANAKVEINFIVGPNRYVRDSNLLEFPYLQAVVTETLRVGQFNPNKMSFKLLRQASLMAITDDRDFSVALHQLRCCGFNILLGCPESSTSNALLLTAATVWSWNSLIWGQKPFTKSEIEDLIAANLKK
ncbi:unnamed protein product [Arabidopsis arenosa]|uniref:Cytochrome P450 n=1 Tax=Arabidopsis arenosa TaxID=38785 RepID=A0A8S2AKV2_ARAAE|nr:unnamed protein product [Arabidopsis arenosa]